VGQERRHDGAAVFYCAVVTFSKGPAGTAEAVKKQASGHFRFSWPQQFLLHSWHLESRLVSEGDVVHWRCGLAGQSIPLTQSVFHLPHSLGAQAMKLLYKWDTRVGTFYIGQSADGRYHPIFGGDDLGSYEHPWQATEDLACGHKRSVVGIDDTSALGIPEHHSKWERLPMETPRVALFRRPNRSSNIESTGDNTAPRQ
jgi:hypothetical protein